MRNTHKVRLSATLAIAASALTLGLIAPSAANAAAKPTVENATITIAEGPQAPPTFILPFVSPSDGFSVTNMNQFQMVMYRPLFWFGAPGSAAYVPALSLGSVTPTTGSSNTFTIDLKGWNFANGQTINAGSVAFFLNLYNASVTGLTGGAKLPANEQGLFYAGYVPFVGIPDGISSISMPQGASGSEIVIHMSSTVNANWLLYNYLSEITPFPSSWDKTSDSAAAGSGHCETDAFNSSASITDCMHVLLYLRQTAATPSDWTNSLWESGTDGPWKLQSADALGNVTFVPNPAYGGPQKAQVSQVKLVPFETSSDELNALKGGSIDLGYVDPTQLTSPSPKPGTPGANLSSLSSNYNLLSGTSWAFNYDLYNLQGDPGSKFLDQLYVRQAMQEATDQILQISTIMKGYGIPTYSPLPYGASSAIAKAPKNPYPFSVSKALALFAAHGWSDASGTQTCAHPGTAANQCGAGIAAGDQLRLSMDQAAGSQTDTTLTAAEVSEWAAIGVKVSVNTDTFSNVLSLCQGSGTGYDMCDWGGGWLYAPDYYPSGEELFATGAGSNTGSYSDPTMDNLINASTSGNDTLTAYEAYAAAQLPVFFKPEGTGAGEVIKTLKSKNGFKSNPLSMLEPEYLYF